MALSANSVIEVQTGGNDTNGGGFVTGSSGTDYSQTAAKRTGTGTDDSTTDAVANGTTTLTSATANFGTSIVGNIIYLQGGTGSLAASWYHVTARANATTITLDRTVAAGTGITMNIGGALASPGMAGGVGLVSGAYIYIKAGTYTITSASTNVSNGCFSLNLTILTVEGYQTNRGDLGTPPLLQASGISTFTMLTLSGGDAGLINVRVDGASLTSSRGALLAGTAYKVTVENCTNSGIIQSANLQTLSCVVTGCATAGAAFNGGNHYNGIAYSNTVPGFEISATSEAVNGCIAYANTGATTDGIVAGDTGAVTNCVSVGNGRDGIKSGDNCIIRNNIVEDNGAGGINCQSGLNTILLNNAGYDNTSGDVINASGKGTRNIGFVTGSASFFTNPAGLDFSLNNTAGGGALARTAGYPGVLPVGGNGYLDIGALQHQDAASPSSVETAVGYVG